MINIACPHCNALLLGRVCEYCGKDSGIEIVSQEDSFKIREDERFKPCDMYARINALYEGEVGKLNGARIVIGFCE